MRRRCPHCEFSYAWDGRFCGHCNVPYPRRPVWDSCTDPHWFPRHHRNTPLRPLLFFGCAAVRQVLRLLPAEGGDVLEFVEDAVRENLRVPSALRPRVEDLATLAGPSGTAGHAAVRALSSLVTAVWAGSRPEKGEVFTAADAVATAEGLVAVPESADERVGRPAFLDDPNRWANQPGVAYGQLPLGLAAAERDEWEGWRVASNRAYQTQAARLTASRAALAALCDLYRDVVPYPFEPVPFDPAWRTTTAVALAAGIDEHRDFATLPILADALQDAGCEDAHVLDHCRGPGTHVRGCWVVEAVLGRG